MTSAWLGAAEPNSIIPGMNMTNAGYIGYVYPKTQKPHKVLITKHNIAEVQRLFEEVPEGGRAMRRDKKGTFEVACSGQPMVGFFRPLNGSDGLSDLAFGWTKVCKVCSVGASS